MDSNAYLSVASSAAIAAGSSQILQMPHASYIFAQCRGRKLRQLVIAIDNFLLYFKKNYVVFKKIKTREYVVPIFHNVISQRKNSARYKIVINKLSERV